MYTFLQYMSKSEKWVSLMSVDESWVIDYSRDKPAYW